MMMLIPVSREYHRTGQQYDDYYQYYDRLELGTRHGELGNLDLDFEDSDNKYDTDDDDDDKNNAESDNTEKLTLNYEG